MSYKSESTHLKMVKSTKKKRSFNNFQGIFLGIVAFTIVTMSLFHVFFKAESTALLSHKKALKEIKVKRKKLNHNLIKSFTEKINKNYPNDKQLQVLVGKFKNDYNLNQKTIHQDIIKYNEIKNNLADDQSFMGRANFRFWIWIFGLTIALLFFAVKSLYHDLTSKSNKYRLDLISYAGISVGFFWLLHILFLTQQDFSKNTYVALILTCAILCAIATYYIVKYFTYKDVLINKLFLFLNRVKNVHVRKLGAKALYAERNNEAMPSATLVEHDLKVFDNELSSAINE